METNAGLSGGIYRLCEWIYRLAYINLLWILFTIAGGVVLGIFPATAAMFAVTRKWINGDDGHNIFKIFLQYYKRDFKESNVVGALLTVVGIFIFIDFQLIGSFGGVIKYVLLGSLATVTILYSLVILYIFPVLTQYKNSVYKHFKSALIIGITYPLRTITMFVSVVSVLFICAVIPAISFLYLGSGLSFVIMFFSHHLFHHIEKNIESPNK
ncbi:YesL family protein [Aquibacillus kalidii]|uniref:YesL family protein n=1 Tax=Aquibacillus kalidii TaxID=2762597 RepID=UPI0016448A59|nr:YesL family protein [Aquibacillus kalidii]